MPRYDTTTTLVLIPKNQSASHFEDLRPISLCNFVYTILARYIGYRLKSILPEVVSPVQYGFVTGRLIQECVGTAVELNHELDVKSRGGRVMFKLDIKKLMILSVGNFCYLCLISWDSTVFGGIW